MKALTLHRPWPFAILHLGKRIENRTHNRLSRYRGWLLLHAGKAFDDSATSWIRERGLVETTITTWGSGEPSLFERLTQGEHHVGIVGRCRVVGHIEPIKSLGHTIPRYSDGSLTLDERWWMGAHALVLADVEACDPVPCRGFQGLWTPPPSVIEQLPRAWRVEP